MTPARLIALAALLGAAATTTHAETWDFQAALDGKPIGSHRFDVTGPPAARQVESRANFDVKVLGIPFYRYRHQASERWQGDCLRELYSTTDDDGKPVKVDMKVDDKCVMGFAYWNPRLHEQTQLLNPQTGLVESAKFEAMPDATLKVRGRDVPAKRWKLTATTPSAQQDIVLWLDAGNSQWIGLDAQVKGRLLTYRLN